jgi:radical SAM superfamily enzyme YgiQ (UPF0313 family)
MKATFKFARKLDPDWRRFNIFAAVPGSALYDEVMQKELYDRIEDFVAYVKTDDFNYESLLEVQRRFHRNFNRSSKRVLRKIRKEGFLSVLKKSPKYLWDNSKIMSLGAENAKNASKKESI